MAELTLQERLQPSLLDRLTDDEPGNLKEAAERRVLTLSQLKASVLRDLAWLFNTTSLFDHGPAARMPAGNSVLNYGLPALAGHTASSVDVHAIEALLTETIATFEPRIIRSSLRVRAQLLPGEMDHNALSFEIDRETGIGHGHCVHTPRWQHGSDRHGQGNPGTARRTTAGSLLPKAVSRQKNER